MEKIYSRRRIRLPKFKKVNKLKLFIFLNLIIMILLILSFVLAAYPIFESSCKNRASRLAINISAEEVNKIMNDYEYEDLIEVQKNEKGDVTLIKAKIIPINEMISKITANIKNEIDKKEQVEVLINMGTITGISGLSAIGPKFNIKMEASGGVSANVNSEFKSVGINQTLHRIYLDINTKASILTPFNIIRNEYQSRVLLTESVIVGNVPDTYYYYDDILQDDVLDTN